MDAGTIMKMIPSMARTQRIRTGNGSLMKDVLVILILSIGKTPNRKETNPLRKITTPRWVSSMISMSFISILLSFFSRKAPFWAG